MGLFDFLKPNKSPVTKVFDKLNSAMFPNGKRDISAGSIELMRILQNRVDEKTAESIFVKSIAISQIAKNFDHERLVVHLQGYCMDHFDDEKTKQFYTYIKAIEEAAMTARKGASELKRTGHNYTW